VTGTPVWRSIGNGRSGSRCILLLLFAICYSMSTDGCTEFCPSKLLLDVHGGSCTAEFRLLAESCC
jgi:hypothetical protein